MSRAFSKIVPQSELEQERFYLDTINKLEGTETTLSDQEKETSGSSSTNGRINDLIRIVTDLQRSERTTRLLVDAVQRREQEIRILRAQQPVEPDTAQLRAQITRLENRIRDIEGQL